MKPSEKIKQLVEEKLAEIRKKFDRYAPHPGMGSYYEMAIMKYLDEEYEKNQPCTHKNAYQVEGIGDVYYNVCNDCGVLFLAKVEENTKE